MKINPEITSFLLDPTRESDRNQARNVLAISNAVTKIASIAGVCFGTFGALIWRSHPITGSIIILSGAVAGVLGREANVIGKNVDRILASNFVQRGLASTNTDTLVDRSLNGTWIINDAFGSLAKRSIAN